MQGSDQIGPLTERKFSFAAVLAVAILLLCFAGVPASAQINGVAPSVTSIPLSHFSPNPRPSVTSLGPFGYGPGIPNGPATGPDVRNYPFRQFPYNRSLSGHGRGGYTYAIPYYIPYDTSGYDYGYDYVGGPDVYSGPPIGPNDPTLHIVVEQPPVLPPQAYQSRVTSDANSFQRPPSSQRAMSSNTGTAAAPAPAPESKPADPTVLVFRDGRKQEVSNYAIMGQVVYVFDDHTKKIPLADLDLNATVKANDDRGTEFALPPQTPPKKKDSSLPRQNPPASSAEKPRDIASSVLP